MSNYLERIGQDKIEDREEIEQLQAKVAELEEEIDRLESESEEYAQLQSRCFDGGGSHASVFDEVSELRAQLAAAQKECEFQRNAHKQAEELMLEQSNQLAAEQLNNKRLRDALQAYIDEHEECQDADDWMAMMCSVEAHHTADEALSHPSDTSALDAYVAEKVKEENDQILAAKNLLAIMHRDGGHHEFAVGFDQAIQDAMAVYYELTRQRDLAVDALEKWDMFFSSDAETAVLTIAEDPSTLTGCQKATKEALSAIKESEAK